LRGASEFLFFDADIFKYKYKLRKVQEFCANIEQSPLQNSLEMKN